MFGDANGVLSRNVPAAFVCFWHGGAGPTRVTLEAAAEVAMQDELSRGQRGA